MIKIKKSPKNHFFQAFLQIKKLKTTNGYLTSMLALPVFTPLAFTWRVALPATSLA